MKQAEKINRAHLKLAPAVAAEAMSDEEQVGVQTRHCARLAGSSCGSSLHCVSLE
jgi:hypothetical protein